MDTVFAIAKAGGQLMKHKLVNYITHKKENDWGNYWFFMASEGCAFARAYMYDDDKSTIYMDLLSVSPECRKQGMGLGLQMVRENLGRRLGCEFSCLWVEKGKWMEQWYERRGYKYYSDHEDGKSVWMRKSL